MTERVIEAMARRAAAEAIAMHLRNSEWEQNAWVLADYALEAACSPSLGDERLVRLGDVIEKLKAPSKYRQPSHAERVAAIAWHGAADFLSEAFGTAGGGENDEAYSSPASPPSSETGAET